MAEPIIFNLPDMGQRAAVCVDLYDEARFGADELAFRGRYYDLAEVKAAIEEVLAAGSPIENPENPATNILSMNRFESSKAKWYRTSYDYEPYINRAAFIIYFRIRVHFNNQVVTIGFGVNWVPFKKTSGKINDLFPLGNYQLDQNITIDDLRLQDRTGISRQDASVILEAIGLTNPVDIEIEDIEQGIDDDLFVYLYKYDVPKGETISSVVDENGEECVLIDDGAIITMDN